MATFNGMDYAVFVLLFLSVAIGVARGFVKEVISFVAWVAAFLVSTLYAVKFAALFTGTAQSTPGANPIEAVSMVAIIISYLVLFFGVLLCGSLVKALASYLVEGSGLGFANRFFGALFGLARGCVIVLILMFFLTFTALTAQALWKDSKLVAVFKPGVKWMSHFTQPYLAQIEAKMKKTAKNLNQEDLSDVIKIKPTVTAPLIPMPVKVPTSTATVPPAATPAPVVTPQTAPKTQ